MSRFSLRSGGGGNNPRPPIRLGMCVGAFVYPQTAASLFSLGGMGKLDYVQASFVEVSRNEIAGRFVKECDEPYLLFIDSDHSFTREDAEMLVDAMEWYPKYGAIMGMTVFRDGRYKPVVQWADGDKFLNGERLYKRTVKKMKEKAIEEVDWIGTGFTIIRREVFRDLEEPYFRVYHDNKKNFWGEDIHFMQSLKDAGWKLGCHFGARIGHIGTVDFKPEELLENEDAIQSRLAVAG